ncbi:type II secretion system F family protein [Aeromicrobium sp. CF3.5]|uniref:type II secretion system F family protein n=1 Tax=Aeromicrobium sp. CF3.5 TaxID=3373078 RepID=UPI003EE738CC
MLSAFGVALYLVLQPSLVRVAPSRRGRTGSETGLSTFADRLAGAVDSALHKGSWSPVSAVSLELAGISTTVGTFLVTVGAGALATVLLVTVVSGSWLFGLAAAALVFLGAKVVLSNRTAKRRSAFAAQLDSTLHLLASALRAGHSLARALDTTARESLSPTAGEVGRLINENRIGRDLVDSMHTTADRMANEDFHWVADAVAMQRETGGNLNEVLERVGNTIRERNALLREVHTLSAEGRGGAKVLMALPILVGGGQGLINPAGLGQLFGTTTGHIALAVSGVLYLAGVLWMRAITAVKL